MAVSYKISRWHASTANTKLSIISNRVGGWSRRPYGMVSRSEPMHTVHECVSKFNPTPLPTTSSTPAQLCFLETPQLPLFILTTLGIPQKDEDFCSFTFGSDWSDSSRLATLGAKRKRPRGGALSVTSTQPAVGKRGGGGGLQHGDI